MTDDRNTLPRLADGRDMSWLLDDPRGIPTGTVEFLRRMGEALPSIRAIILFGSRARGEASETSDLDTCTVVESDDPYEEDDTYLAMQRARVAVPGDPPIPNGSWDNLVTKTGGLREPRPYSVWGDIAREGVVLYER